MAFFSDATGEGINSPSTPSSGSNGLDTAAGAFQEDESMETDKTLVNITETMPMFDAYAQNSADKIRRTSIQNNLLGHYLPSFDSSFWETSGRRCKWLVQM
jgi:hypothetical protein